MTSDEFLLILEGLVDSRHKGLRRYRTIIDHEKFLQYRVEYLEGRIAEFEHIGTGAGRAVQRKYE